MALILKNLTLPKYSVFGFFFERPKILAEYLSDADSNWFVMEEKLQDQTSKLLLLDEQEARTQLCYNETVCKISQVPFHVKLQFQELNLADGNTLTLNISIQVKITNPLRFYQCHLAKFRNETELDSDSLHELWETPFWNVFQVGAHKVRLSNWKNILTGPAITKAFQRYYYAPMATRYLDGTELLLVETIEGYSPSENKRLQQEIERKQREYEEQQNQIIAAQNKAQHEAELERLREQIRLKELELKEKQETRLAQEAEYQRQLEEEKRIAERERQRMQAEILLEAEQTKKWPELSVNEKSIAIDFSALIKNQAESNGIDMKNTAISASSILYNGVWGQWNKLRKGDSLEFSFTSSKSGFVTILNLGTSGKMTIVLPNALTGSDPNLVKAEQGVNYNFPLSFMPDLEGDFEEDASSGLEGIYVLVTEKPFFQFEQSDDIDSLAEISYDNVQSLIKQLLDMDANSWAAGFLEFEVVE